MSLVRSRSLDGLVIPGNLAAAAAAAGILAGLSACQISASPPADAVTVELPPAAKPEPRNGAAQSAEPLRVAQRATQRATLSCCAGRNECKGKGNCKVQGMHDCMGKNECKGKGGCRGRDCSDEVQVKNCCKGRNDCKGLGGCKTQGSSCKGMNNCKGLGGCASARCLP